MPAVAQSGKVSAGSVHRPVTVRRHPLHLDHATARRVAVGQETSREQIKEAERALAAWAGPVGEPPACRDHPPSADHRGQRPNEIAVLEAHLDDVNATAAEKGGEAQQIDVAPQRTVLRSVERDYVQLLCVLILPCGSLQADQVWQEPISIQAADQEIQLWLRGPRVGGSMKSITYATRITFRGPLQNRIH